MKKNRKKIDMVKNMKKKRKAKKHDRFPSMKKVFGHTFDGDTLQKFMSVVSNGATTDVGMQWVEPRVLKVTRTDKNRHRLHIDWSGGQGQPDCSHVQITRHGENNFEWYDEGTDFLRQDMKLDFLLWDHDLHRDERLKQTILELEY